MQGSLSSSDLRPMVRPDVPRLLPETPWLIDSLDTSSCDVQERAGGVRIALLRFWLRERLS